MKSRLEKDLEDMAKDDSQHTDLVQRHFLGVDVGNQNAFVNFALTIFCGPFSGCRVNMTIKVDADYPYTPPEVYCHDSDFLHPNMDMNTRQLMFSLVSQQHWKPTFELKQVVCGIEMIMITPETAYASVRSTMAFRHALDLGSINSQINRSMDIENDTRGKEIMPSTRYSTYRTPCSREPSYDVIRKPCTRVKII